MFQVETSFQTGKMALKFEGLVGEGDGAAQVLLEQTAISSVQILAAKLDAVRSF